MTEELLNDVLVSRDETAARLGVTTRTVDRWRAAGKLQDVPVGDTHVMISLQSINDFLRDSRERRTHRPTG